MMTRRFWTSLAVGIVTMALLAFVAWNISYAQEQPLSNPIVRPDIDKFALTSLSWDLRPNGNLRGLTATYVLGYVDGEGNFHVLDDGVLAFTRQQVIANMTQAEIDAMLSIRNKVIQAIGAQVNP